MKKLIFTIFFAVIQFIPNTVQAAVSNDLILQSNDNEKAVVEVNQLPAVVKGSLKNFNFIGVTVSKVDKESTVKVTLSNGVKEGFEVKKGNNLFEIQIPEVRQQGTIKAEVEFDGKSIEKEITIKPVPNWTIYLVEHTHTDVGYPEPQSEIMPEQLRYIDYALDYCDETDNYPDNAKFRWTCETAWAVQKYLRVRPKAQVERLLKRIKEGRIEVTGLYLNMSDMWDESCISDLLKVVKDFKDKGIKVQTAMQDDVNGAAWCLADYLKSAGIKYLSMGENGTHARRPFDKPTAFWWESPSGNKILAYRAEHYHFGNMLGILKGMNSFESSLLPYLNKLKDNGYPFDRTMIQFSGYWIDDSPPSITACELVKEWNEKFEYPKLKLSTVSEFFNYIEKNDASKLPTYQLAWPDWWTDGAGSCALETAYVRNTQTDFIANQGLMSMAKLLGADIKPDALRAMNSINDNIAFFDEHTFGAAESVRQPLSLSTAVQWNQKSAYAWTAVKDNGILQQESLGLRRQFLPKYNFPSITVFNTMNTVRSGVAKFFAYDAFLPADKKVKVIDADGNEFPLRRAERGPGGFYWEIYVNKVPAFGYKTFKIIPGDEQPVKPSEQIFTGTLENKFYKLEVDTTKGGIISLIDKSDDRQLVDSKASWELGQFIYERLGDRKMLWGPGNVKYSPGLFTRTSMTNIKVGKVFEGPIWTSVNITGQVDGCADSNGVRCEIRLYNFEKKIQLVYSMDKLQVFEPEAAYVAFPFAPKESQISFEVQGGSVVPGKDQLPGSASDWDGVQNFASVRSNGGQIVFTSPEAPLMEFGDINTGKWQETSKVENPYIYSYVLNNYWGTNFRAGQEGGLRWTYDLTSSSDTSVQFAAEFGWGSRVPLVAMVRSGDGKSANLESKSILNFDSKDLLLVFARPAWNGNGVVFCMRETNGENASLNISKLISSKSSYKVYEVNSLEEQIRSLTGSVRFKPHEVKFILLKR